MWAHKLIYKLSILKKFETSVSFGDSPTYHLLILLMVKHDFWEPILIRQPWTSPNCQQLIITSLWIQVKNYLL